MDVVVPVQLNSNLTLFYPVQVDWEKFITYRPDILFSDGVIGFLNILSGGILKDRNSRLCPDMITFAFLYRKANLQKLKGEYVREELCLGRGVLLHITPSNVPISFGYSLVTGPLSSNINIVRVGSKQLPQVDLITKHLYEVPRGELYDEIASRITLVCYDRTSDTNAYFSSIANAHAVWRGDATIATTRQSALPARPLDVCLAGRHSAAAINLATVISATDVEVKRLAGALCNDTYLFDQNVCSAPYITFWLSADCLEAAKDCFWNTLHDYVLPKYQLQAIMSVNKLTAFYRQTIYVDVKIQDMPDNLVFHTELSELPEDIEEFRCAYGCSSRETTETIGEIASIVTVKYQTLGYYGFKKEELVDFVRRNRSLGLDRIVSIGETTNLTLTWDGYNLIDTSSRFPNVL